jgi:hypothetical protein
MQHSIKEIVHSLQEKGKRTLKGKTAGEKKLKLIIHTTNPFPSLSNLQNSTHRFSNCFCGTTKKGGYNKVSGDRRDKLMYQTYWQTF